MLLNPKGDEEGVYIDAFRMGLLNSRLEFCTGRVVSHDQVKR